MHVPVAVPAYGAPTSTADTEPVGWKVTLTCPAPVGPSARLQLATLMPSARAAAGRSNGDAEVTADLGASAVVHAAPAERRI